MTSTYAGASQEIAVRVQGFKDYLVGSLQDLVATAEKINLISQSTQPETEAVIVTEKISPRSRATTPVRPNLCRI